MEPEELTPEQKLKGALIFKFLKTGKMPQRKNLFKNLFYLAGIHPANFNVGNTSSSVTKKRSNLDRYAQLFITFPPGVGYSNTMQKINETFTKYLVDFKIKIDYNCLYLYYSYKNIQWSKIDEELRKNHSENIREVDGIPKIINHKYNINKNDN